MLHVPFIFLSRQGLYALETEDPIENYAGELTALCKNKLQAL